MPSDYHLPGAMPRLPSYESVRRTDQRTHIHHMIAERFGLRSTRSQDRDWESPPPPPSYEETLQPRQPLEVPSLGLRRLDDEAVSDQPGQQWLNQPGMV
ncbi:hypothetical protein NHX12_025025 [Muraenolepis orangiensis]|uniref:Uncharacterized protein n=1 Tax=Muraenolepis orangiensis TaxID=630683 RepID=A0A9Q0IR86_9TELE|nr:hypothetical protein NHX12_025025 [Muraenolepis orangiensis]